MTLTKIATAALRPRKKAAGIVVALIIANEIRGILVVSAILWGWWR